MKKKGNIAREIKERRIRPTSNKVREALFNILGEKTDNAVFLDLYAGTGAVGITALKKGASEVVFVEPVRSYAGAIDALLKKLNFAGEARIVAKKALPFVDWAEAGGLSFDIIFLDPPYHTDEIMSVLAALGTSHIPAYEGVVIAEHFIKTLLPERFDKLCKIKDYKYGDTVLSFYVRSI